MSNKVIDINEKFSKFHELWSPKVIAELNDYQIKIVKIKGEFTWHTHTDTDELFFVIEGKMGIEFPDHSVELNKGEMIVVSKGIEHKPFSEYGCKVMVIEPGGVSNTGDDVNSNLTYENDVWI